ncbi:hypothetical protein M9H77_18485 [Catharanthus roseus]|uniref:Uncharacterized protein n=1 Tax=Catharanthus roseus TaxID=4058 RepID=A0ACC0B7S2_CATRO|nr:hypothetical protein M9H77_18485 [Catharanthus roseus]
MTRAQRKKLKLQEDNGMNAHIMEVFKSKDGDFEAQEKHPKLLKISWHPTVSGRVILRSLVGFCVEFIEGWQPAVHSRPYPTVVDRSRERKSLTWSFWAGICNAS